MKSVTKWSLTLTAAALLVAPAIALDGDPGMHDPSTVVMHEGKFYSYGTGGGLPISISDDGWTWRRSGTLMQAVPGGRPGQDTIARGGNNTWAPDVIRSGDNYFVYYSAPGTQPKAAIGLLVGKTLDPASPDYRWEDRGPVVWSDGVEDSNAIDPGVFRDPTNSTWWLTYGSYFGYIRLVQLDPKTGKRLYPNQKPVNVAINGEASIVIFRDGWYYLLMTRGSCCAGANSSYHLRMGRSRKVTGPYVDNIGIDMLQGGGKLFLGSSGRFVGPGHFGLLDLGDGVQKFSLHYEADLDRGGISVLDIRPLLWRDGWPVAGENFKAGTYQIESVRTGTALEMAVQGVPVGGARGGRGGGRGAPPAGGRGGPPAGGGQAGPPTGGQAGPPAGRQAGPPADGRGGPPDGRAGGGRGNAPATPVPDQDPAQVSTAWPAGPVDARLSPYMLQAQQKWTITPAQNAGGYPGSPYFRISIAGTERTLAATEDRELAILPAFTGAPEQLWRIDQLADGSYRVMPKSIPNSRESLALSAVGTSMPTLARFDPASDRQRWAIKTP